MTNTIRHLRPLFIGLVALFLTAGIAFAAKPGTTGAGTDTGSHASGKVVPVVHDGGTAPSTDEDTDSQDTSTDGKTADTADHCSVDPTGLNAEALAALNHGLVVCWAAHQPTPDGYRNHGAFVSEWAHKNHGSGAAATGKAHANGKSNGHAHGGDSSGS